MSVIGLVRPTRLDSFTACQFLGDAFSAEVGVEFGRPIAHTITTRGAFTGSHSPSWSLRRHVCSPSRHDTYSRRVVEIARVTLFAAPFKASLVAAVKLIDHGLRISRGPMVAGAEKQKPIQAAGPAVFEPEGSRVCRCNGSGVCGHG